MRFRTDDNKTSLLPALLVALLVSASTVAAQQATTQGCCEQAPQSRAETKGCCGQGADATMKGRMGMGSAHRDFMSTVHTLIDRHDAIEREIVELENGVETTTIIKDGTPEMVETLQAHVRQAYELIESGSSVRHWDPLFVEIFEHADKIVMELENLPNGIRVVETSSDPQVALLVKAHAIKVNEFVARGMEAMHEPTPLPDGYQATAQSGARRHHGRHRPN